MKKILLFLLCISGLYSGLRGQSWQYFHTPSVFNGLLSDDIRNITIAPSGKIWCSTWGGGASRFESGTWQTYTSANFPLSVNDISDIVIDDQGAAWMATYGGGIVRFDGSVTNYNINTNGSFLTNMITSATKDHQGNLWFGTEDGGALKWNGTDFSTFYMNNSGLKSNKVKKVIEDQAGTLWFATWGGGISKFDGSNWVTYTVANTNSALKSDFIYDLAVDPDGNIWMATHVSGICKYSVNTQSFDYYNEGNSILPRIAFEPTNLSVSPTGDIWVGSPYNGVFKFNGSDWSVFNSDNSGLTSNSVNKITFDGHGSVWIGTKAGLCAFKDAHWTAYNKENTAVPGLKSNTLLSHIIAHNGVQWMITDNANITRYDGSTWTHYNHDNNSNLPAGGLTCITEDLQGNIWIGTRDNGAYKFDGITWTAYTTGNSQIGSNFVTSICCDKQGNIWTGSYDHGLSKFDGQNWSVNLPFSNGFNARLIQCLLPDSQGNLWIGTIDEGLYKFNGTTFTAHKPNLEGVFGGGIVAMTMGHSGRLWLGAQGGLLQFDIEHGQWQQFTTANSPLINPLIRTLSIDEQNNVWIGTDGGISVYNGSGWATFVGGLGSLPSNKVSAIHIDAQNNKWIATSGGGLCKLLDGTIDFQLQKIWYVRQNATGAGHSWADASGNLAVAIQNANPGDSIFVASGTYQPAQDSFFVMKAGVKLFGGFQGTETDFSQRNTDNAFKSILKGNGSAIIVNNNNSLSNTAVLDGFTLTQGRGHDIYGLPRGGALFNVNVSPTITACIFEGNHAGTGGAVYNQASGIVFKDCQFLNNSVNLEYNGGAICDETSGNSYINCIFRGNRAGNSTGEFGAGGAAALLNTSCAFFNCLFLENKSLGKNDGGGGALFIDNSLANIFNCTFYGNSSTALLNTQLPQGNTISIDAYGSGNSRVRLLNSIIDGVAGQHIAQLTGNSLDIEHSVIRGYNVDVNQDGVIDEKDVIDNLPFDTDPMFIDVAGGDFRLQPASPCISAGLLKDFYPIDLAGNARVVDEKIDLGAFQSKGLEFSAIPGQKLTSDRADTAQGGVIYLYNTTENAVIVGVNPNGQDLGNIEATGSLSENYGSGQPTTLESPFGIEGEVHCLNRSWHVTLTNPDFNSPVTVQFFIDTTDLRDLIREMPSNTKLPHTLQEWKAFAPLIQVYKVEGDDAYASGASNYKQYTFSEDNQTADLDHFRVGQYQQLFYLEFQVAEFSSGSVAYIPLATPIQLLRFEGTLRNGQAAFTWQTGEEVNFRQFDLEKSTDNIGYKSVATISPTGNNSSYKKSILQSEPSAYYRLKLIDQNGKSNYSKVVRLTQENKGFTLYPNPAEDYIMINSLENGQLFIYDASGKQIKSEKIMKGPNRIEISNLSKGVYYIRFNHEKVKLLKK